MPVAPRCSLSTQYGIPASKCLTDFFYDLNLNVILPSSEQYCACYESSLFVSPNMIDKLVSIAT